MKKPEKAAPFETFLFDSEWIPTSSRIPRSEQKLMIVLHGRGDSLDSYLEIRDELGLKNMNYLLINAPKKYERGYSWCALKPTETSLIPIRARLFALIQQLEEVGWKSENIFLLGHSQGCLVAADLVLNYPRAFGGFIGVSGYVAFFRGWQGRLSRTGARKTPWLFTHGNRDRLITRSEIRNDIRQLVGGNIGVLYREFAKGHDFDFEDEVPFIRSWLGMSRSRRLASTAIHLSF